MKPPIFVRKFSTDESKGLEAGLRSKDTFTLRRSQMLVASSRGNVRFRKSLRTWALRAANRARRHP
jgi:hypothetical protein